MQPAPGRQPATRARGIPARDDAWGVLAVRQFFVGGAVLWALALASVIAMWTDYEGGIAAIGLMIGPVFLAAASAIAAMVVGLPLRLISGLRRRWLANGEVTVGGVVIGFIVLMAGVSLTAAASAAGSSEFAGWQAVVVGWSILCVSVIHFVWPRRWRRPHPPLPHSERADHTARARDLHLAAPWHPEAQPAADDPAADRRPFPHP